MCQVPHCTRPVRRHARRPVIAFAAAIALTLAVPAGAALRTWPGSSPCNTTLQACLDAADAGDIVEIASDGPITGPVELYRKSLTLRAAAGFSPVVQAGSFTNVIDAFGADTLVAIVIEGLTIRGGTIDAYQAGTGPFGLTIRGNTVEADGLDANRTGIRLGTFGSTPTGPVNFAIVDNTVNLGFLQGDDISAIGVEDLPGSTIGVIDGNTVGNGGTFSTLSAIRVRNSLGSVDLQVSRNRVAAVGYNGGILLVQEGAGSTLDARVFDNLVTGTVGVTGPQPGAISLIASAGAMHADVINNTLAGNHTGFIASAGAGASIDGALANTVIANNGTRGVVIDAAIAGNFPNEHNLVFGNGSNEFTPGTGTVLADPRFVGAQDFHLRSNSPARDAGNTALAAGISVDLDDAPRVFGAAVDIGAWEIGDSIFANGFDA
jgi:hypothetical protein